MELSEDEVDEPAEVEVEDEEEGRNILEPQVIVASMKERKSAARKIHGRKWKFTFLQGGKNFGVKPQHFLTKSLQQERQLRCDTCRWLSPLKRRKVFHLQGSLLPGIYIRLSGLVLSLGKVPKKEKENSFNFSFSHLKLKVSFFLVKKRNKSFSFSGG